MNQSMFNRDTFVEKARKTGTYSAGLVATMPLVPVLAALISLIIYLRFSQLPSSTLIAPLVGTLLVITVWLILAIPYRRFTAVDRAHKGVYDLLITHLQLLESFLAALEPEMKPGTLGVLARGKQEVDTYVNATYRSLLNKNASWISASGYINAWKLVARAEEACIIIESDEEVIVDVLLTEMMVAGLTIKNKDDLLMQLREVSAAFSKRVETTVDTQGIREGKKYSSGSRTIVGDEASSTPASKGALNKLAHQGNHREASMTGNSPELDARIILRDVLFSLNQFVNNQRVKLVQARNQIVMTTIITELVLYSLLEFAIVSGIHIGVLMNGFIFFLVGASAGLLIHLLSEPRLNIRIEDYGLTRTTLFASVLLSGLAAVGGTLLFHVLFIVTLNGTWPLTLSVGEFSTFGNNLFFFSLFVAAIFGLTPNLVTRSFIRETNQYRVNLNNSMVTPSGERLRRRMSQS